MESRSAGRAVLFVDDEGPILRAIQRSLRNESIKVLTAQTSSEALDMIEREPVAVLVSDQNLDSESGAALLGRVRERRPDIVRLMLTGQRDMDVAIDAVNQGGIQRLLTKPWSDADLRSAIRQALETYELQREVEHLHRVTRDQNRELADWNQTLERKVQHRTLELRRAYVETVRALAEAVDAKDAYTRGHSERVGIYASRISRELGCSNRLIERIYLAGLLHDIGKIGVPDAVLLKPRRLDEAESLIMAQHPEIGARILEPVRFLADIVPCVRHHHEWYDGSSRGYPERLAGVAIPLASRIIQVSDTVEAMSSDRPYRKGLPLDRVTEELRLYSGTQFDPEVVDACLHLLDEEGTDFLEQASKFDIEAFLLQKDGRRSD
jgi:putative nucleotidyltransferase with HDIG domain